MARALQRDQPLATHRARQRRFDGNPSLTRRIFIAGHYGFGNTGDEAILCSMAAHLRELRPDVQITVATGTPEKTAAALGADAILWSDARAVFEAVREADLVIVGGGGIFHDYAGVNPDTFLTDNHWGISYFAGPAMMAALCERPLMLYAVGVGPLFSDHARQLTKIACDAAAAITVRDAGSKQLLESIGVAADRVTLAADPVFGFPVQEDWIPPAPFSEAPRPRVAVALRRWEVGVHEGFWEREAAAGLDHFVRDCGGTIQFIPFERPENTSENDLDVARRVHSYMKERNAASVCEADLSPGQIRRVLGEFDLVVGMRLHSLILGMLAKVPPLALSYDAKVDEAMRRTGLEEFNLDIRSLDALTLATAMKQALRAKRLAVVEELACAARQNAVIAIAALDRGKARPFLKSPVAAMLSRGIQAQLREAYDLRRETRRLFHELEYYQAKHSSAAAEVNRLTEDFARLERERTHLASDLAARSEVQSQAVIREVASQKERAILQTRADELSGQLAEVVREKGRFEENAARLEREASVWTERVGELEEQRSHALTEWTALAATAQQERTALTSLADELAGQLAQMAQDNRGLRDEIFRLKADVHGLRHKLDASAAERNRLAKMVTDLEADRSQTRSDLAALSEARNRAGATAALLQEERTALLASAEEREGQLAQLARDNQRLERLLQAEAQQRLQALAEHRATLEKQVSRQASLEDELAKRTCLQREASEHLRQAEELRRQVVGRLHQFHNKFAAEVELYRSQRAWKVMLAIRKAYTLYTRRGIGALVRWTAALPFAGPGALQEYELEFPDLRNYLPERLHSAHQLLPQALDAPRKLADLFPDRKYDVVILAIFDFDFRFQRPQQVAAQFARLGHRVFWVSPARFLDSTAEKPYEAVALRANLWEVRLRGRRPDLYGGQASPEETASHTASLKCLYRDFQLSESCALLQFPYWRQLGLALRDEAGAVLVYDCMDDWQNWTAEPRIGAFSLAEERKLTRDCDVLVVSSQEFLERNEGAGLSPVLMRNGADFEFFTKPQTGPEQNDLLAGIPKPIVGYYGAIADWFDLELVTAAASAYPHYSFVLIGQVHQVDTSRLRALPNVHLLGEKHYREIPLFLSHFDVCLIPFKLTALTKGVDPVKLYEYLSQGKPVVATDMAELPRDPNLLYTAADAPDFVRKIELAMQEKGDRAKQTSRVEYARANTWASRVADLDRAITSEFPLVSILIVTHNCEEFIEPCLDAVAINTSWPRYEVILVDNHSTDGSQEFLDRYAKADERIRLIPQSENLGFAAANNLAAQMAQGEYIVFLNPDTVVSPGWLGRMIRHCELDSTVGAVAAVTNFSGNETKITIDYSNVTEMHKFALDLASKKQNQSISIDVAPLYCVVVPGAVWRKVGELDSGFQVGMFEDDDFSFRIKQAGYRIVAAEDSFVHHFGNGSFSKLAPELSLRIFKENRQRFESKWGIPWQPHKLRSGVRPPGEEAKFTPAEFLRAGEISLKTPEPLIINRLHPSRTVAGEAFNAQTGGASALVIECASATPTTVIVMGSTMLQTSYGAANLLSGLVPPELYARPGKRQVYLLNDFGESNSLEFEVVASEPI